MWVPVKTKLAVVRAVWLDIMGPFWQRGGRHFDWTLVVLL